MDPYASDAFRMFDFKVKKCARGRSHERTDCHFPHPSEKARCWDLIRFHYSGVMCPDFCKWSDCRHGDECRFVHGVFDPVRTGTPKPDVSVSSPIPLPISMSCPRTQVIFVAAISMDTLFRRCPCLSCNSSVSFSDDVKLVCKSVASSPTSTLSVIAATITFSLSTTLPCRDRPRRDFTFVPLLEVELNFLFFTSSLCNFTCASFEQNPIAEESEKSLENMSFLDLDWVDELVM
ncbi:hypothetical protein AMTRI_Chr09g42340 [Amborella trichopoda]